MKKKISYVVEDYDSEWMRSPDLLTALTAALNRSRMLGEPLEEYTTVREVITDADTNQVLETKVIDWRREVNQLMYGIGRP